MSSNLEKFVQRSRGDFDEAQPREEIWNRIEATLPVKKAVKLFSINELYKWTAAAAILCIIATSAYFLYVRQAPTENKDSVQNQPDHLRGIDPEYTTQVNQAFSAIQTRQEELKNVTAGRPELYQQFAADLRVLDSSYKMLQTQAAQSPNSDVIMKAMIQNLQLQAELLYRQIMIGKEINNHQKNESKQDKISIQLQIRMNNNAC